MDATCVKCPHPSEHSIQIRNGDPTRDDSSKPDKSQLCIVRLCTEHWEELRLFLGIGLA